MRDLVVGPTAGAKLFMQIFVTTTNIKFGTTTTRPRRRQQDQDDKMNVKKHGWM